MLNKNKVLTFGVNGGIIKVSKLFIVIGGNKNMNIIERLNNKQVEALKRVAKEHGYFFNNTGSQELREDGTYVIHLDMDTGCAATIGPRMGMRIAAMKAFEKVDFIYFRGSQIWPRQATQLF